MQKIKIAISLSRKISNYLYLEAEELSLKENKYISLQDIIRRILKGYCEKKETE